MSIRKYVVLKTLLYAMVTFPVLSGCASMPITSQEKIEYRESIGKLPDAMKFYRELLNTSNRAPMSIKLIDNFCNDTGLRKNLVKSRKKVTNWERFKRNMKKKPITREELEIRLDLY